MRVRHGSSCGPGDAGQQLILCIVLWTAAGLTKWVEQGAELAELVRGGTHCCGLLGVGALGEAGQCALKNAMGAEDAV